MKCSAGRPVAFAATLLIAVAHANAASIYYVANGGDDANAGTSAAAPWATVEKVNSTRFRPGDQILFQRGGQ